MKVFLSIKYYPDLSNQKKIERILEILERCGTHSFCLARDIEKWGQERYDSRALMRIALREIRDTHLVIADLEEKGVGIGIECGYAVARGIPVLAIAPQGCDIPPTLQGISSEIVFYAGFDDLERRLKQLVGDQAN